MEHEEPTNEVLDDDDAEDDDSEDFEDDVEQRGRATPFSAVVSSGDDECEAVDVDDEGDDDDVEHPVVEMREGGVLLPVDGVVVDGDELAVGGVPLHLERDAEGGEADPGGAQEGRVRVGELDGP